MPKHVPNRGELHTAIENRNGPDTIHYCLQALPLQPSHKGKQRVSARIIEKETVGSLVIAQRITAENPTIPTQLAHMVLESAANIMLQELRQGHRVTIENVLSIGLSLKGTVDPKRPLDAKKLTLTPWARFARTFTTALNKGAQLAYEPDQDILNP